MRTLFGAALAAMLLASAPAMAKPIPSGGVTAKDVADALQAEGYKAEISKDGEGDPMIISAAEGYNFRVFFYGCKSGRCTTYQMSVGFDLDSGTTLEKVNEWNRKHRFGRSFLDDDKDPYMQMDIDAEEGFSTEAIKNNLLTWVSVLASFKKFFDA